MSMRKLKEELAIIIALIPVLSGKTELKKELKKAKEIINELKERSGTINFYMEVNKNYIKILDYIRSFDTQTDTQEDGSTTYHRLGNAALLELEQYIENAQKVEGTQEERLQKLLQEINDFKNKNQKSVWKDIKVGAGAATLMFGAVLCPFLVTMFCHSYSEQLEELPMSGMLATTVALAGAGMLTLGSQALVLNSL